MAVIEIDGRRIETPDGRTVLQTAEAAGIDIPHFCYHPAFAPEGSCRMCLVEVEGSPKLELACNFVVRDGLKVRTATPAVREARRSVLEFLLADHPLDCPICDKAGECRLQDYYQDYGLTEGRNAEAKERREKKVRIGEKLLLDRERCIQCTRCVRFLADVTKTNELGVVDRGVHSEIAVFPDQLVRSVDSGNLVDLCPVGAITSTDFRFKTRPWFLKHADSICPLCARGCSITIDHHPGFVRVPGSARIYRVRPRRNDAVNGHFICDHGRAGFVESQRVNRRMRIGGTAVGAGEAWDWDRAIGFLAEKIATLLNAGATDRIGILLHCSLTTEELGQVKRLIDLLGGVRTAFIDPPDAEPAGLLLGADRTANRAGASALGFETRGTAPAAVAASSELLIAFETDRTAVPGGPEALASPPRSGPTVLFTTHETPLAKVADLVLPVAAPAENRGSYTNAAGLVQSFGPAVAACGDVRPAADVLGALVGALEAKR